MTAHNHGGGDKVPYVFKIVPQRRAGPPRKLLALLTAFLVSLLLISLAGSSDTVMASSGSLAVLACCMLVCMVSLALASNGKRIRFGLQMMLIYTAIYLILPGYHHASINTYPFYSMHYPYNVQEQSAWIIGLFLVSCIAAYGLSSFKPQRVRPLGRHRRVIGEIGPRAWLVVTLLCLGIASAAYYVHILGFRGAFSSRSDAAALSAASDQLNDAISSGLALTLPRIICAASLIYSFVLWRFGRRNRYVIVPFLLNIPIFLTTNWPLALARFSLFGYVLMFLILLVDFRRSKYRTMLPLVFFLGAVLAMPVADMLTRNHDKTIDYSDLFSEYFESGDFDGLQSINNSVIFVDHNGPQFGKQLLSVALFFVPRSIWAGKSEPTGVLTARAAHYQFVNISQPLPSEFYVDFGLAGVIVGGFILGWLLASADSWIDRHWDTDPAARMMAGFLVAYSIIVYRGSLLGIIAPISILGLLVWLIVKFGLVPRRSSGPKRRILIPVKGAPAPKSRTD